LHHLFLRERRHELLDERLHAGHLVGVGRRDCDVRRHQALMLFEGDGQDVVHVAGEVFDLPGDG
jgi:hypothetical protein